MKGYFEQVFDELKMKSAKSNYLLSPKHIAETLAKITQGELDAHLIIGGQNGVGKSYAMLAIAKETLSALGIKKDMSLMQAYNDGYIEPIFAFNTQHDLIRLISEPRQHIFLIDELKPFFDYRMTMTKLQTYLYNSIEVARERRNIFIGCARDYTKLDINYRNAKAQMLIYIYDKVVDAKTKEKDGAYKTLFSYGSVHISNASIEYEDKFMFSYIRGYDISTTKALAERLPTWAGNIIFDRPEKYNITKDDLKLYHELKSLGMQEYGNVAIEITQGRKLKNKKDVKGVQLGLNQTY